MKRYSIHSVAELLGVSADAIRLYEKEGLVKPLRDEKTVIDIMRMNRFTR